MIYLICDRQSDLPAGGPASLWAKQYCNSLQAGPNTARNGDWAKLGHNIKVR